MSEIGDNSKLTEQEHQAIWGHHVSRGLAVRRRMDEVKADAKVNVTDAKNDGFSKAEIDDFLDLMTTDDPQKKVDKFNMMKRNRIRLGLIPDDRKSDLLADRVTNLEMIFASGVEAGLAGLDRVSKHSAGGDEDRAFLDGYDEGQRIVRDNLQSAMEKRNAARKKDEPAPAEADPFEVMD